MYLPKHLVRLALLAALTALPLPAIADTAAQYDPVSGNIAVSGLEAEMLQSLVTSGDMVRLSVAGQISTRSMPLTVAQDGTGLVVDPRFSLRPGTHYALTVGDTLFDVAIPAPVNNAPRIMGFAPSQALIPANTLRIYLNFSEPMARGQLREQVSLLRSDGMEVESPFLNLESELWDADQRRATLLFDPGRIKQGVGPNLAGDAPLQAGESYRLIVSEQMRSAAGVPLDAQVTLAFRAGPAERSEIDPFDWDILNPRAGTLTPISVAFDRIMDSGAVARLLTLEAPDGTRVRGEVQTDGGGWSLAPTGPWTAGHYRLIVDPELEDVSGNTPGVPFDAAVGTIGLVQEPTILTITIAE